MKELTGNKKALIAINHFQSFDPLCISSFNQSINATAIWNGLAKGSVKMIQTLTILADLIKASGCKVAIRMEEQEELAGRERGPMVLLDASPWARYNNVTSETFGNRNRRVGTASICDDNFIRTGFPTTLNRL